MSNLPESLQLLLMKYRFNNIYFSESEKNMKKYIVSFTFLIIVVLSGCTSNPVYNDNYYANVHTEFHTLHPGDWKVVPNTSIQWYQEFRLPMSGFENFDYAGVMVYYLNQYEAWEALPSTRIFWTDDDVVYSDELWFSHNLEFLYLDYRNTIPGAALPPKDPIRIKAIYFDDAFYNSVEFKSLDLLNYEEVKSHLNLKD